MDDLERGSGLDVGFSPAARLARRMMIPIVGVLVLCAAVPAVASARVGWRVNGTPLGESVATTWKGTMQLTDTKATVPMGIKCEDTVEGSPAPVGPVK